MSAVFVRDKKLLQQAYINVGLNVLATDNVNDYGWSVITGVTGTVVAHGAAKAQTQLPLNKIISPVTSNYIGEYGGDSVLLKEKIKQWEAKYGK